MENHHQAKQQQTLTPRVENLSTPELIRLALEDAKLLVRTEVQHAKLELQAELASAKRTGALLGAALVLSLSAFSVFFVLVASLLPLSEPVRLLIVGAALLLMAGLFAFIGVRQLKHKPMAHTQERIKRDLVVTRHEALQ
jgi:uncharacterized membrane protein YqjE